MNRPNIRSWLIAGAAALLACVAIPAGLSANHVVPQTPPGKQVQATASSTQQPVALPATVAQVGSSVVITPAPTASCKVTVSASTSDPKRIVVEVDDQDPRTYLKDEVGWVIFNGSNTEAGTTQTFVNRTSVMTQVVGGAGTNVFTAGTGMDIFIGGSGSNTMTAGSGWVQFQTNGTTTINQGTGFGQFFVTKRTTIKDALRPTYAVTNQ